VADRTPVNTVVGIGQQAAVKHAAHFRIGQIKRLVIVVNLGASASPRADQAADLGRNHEIITILPGQGPADTAFGQAVAIEWCGVDIADSGVKYSLESTLGIRFGHLLQQVTDRCRTRHVTLSAV
jgi:hypothetical protein